MSDVSAPAAVGDPGAGGTENLPGYFPQLTKPVREQLIDRFGADGLPRTMSDLALALGRNGGQEAVGGLEGTVARKQEDTPDVPETPDGYTFDEIKLPDGMQRDPLFEQYLRDAGIKGKLTRSQAKALYEGFHETYLGGVSKTIQEAVEKQKPEAEKLLRDSWGASYAEESTRADQILQTFGDDDLKAAYNASPPRVQAVLKRFFARIGDKMSPDTFVVPEGPAEPPQPKPGQFSYGFDPRRKG